MGTGMPDTRLDAVLAPMGDVSDSWNCRMLGIAISQGEPIYTRARTPTRAE
jgi:hypothetical protein